MQNKLIPIFIVVLLAVAGGSFYGGMLYGKSRNSGQRNFSPANMQGRFQQGNGAGVNGNGNQQRNRANFISGEIIKKDDSSVTVKLMDGGSKTIYFSDKTTVGKTVEGNQNDLEVGKAIMVSGTSGSDGSLVADNIQLRNAVQAPPVKNQTQIQNQPNSQQQTKAPKVQQWQGQAQQPDIPTTNK